MYSFQESSEEEEEEEENEKDYVLFPVPIEVNRKERDRHRERTERKRKKDIDVLQTPLPLYFPIYDKQEHHHIVPYPTYPHTYVKSLLPYLIGHIRGPTTNDFFSLS